MTLHLDHAVVDTGDRRSRKSRAAGRARVRARATIDDGPLDYRHAWDGATLWLHTTGGDFAFECRRREPARSGVANGDGAREVRASINARVAEVVAQAGARVQPGDRLVVLEAMKMEHDVRATRDATVAEVGVRAASRSSPARCSCATEENRDDVVESRRDLCPHGRAD